MTLFSGHGLACRRGERLILKGLDFALAAGGALLLTGPNGSGKSSLLRLMAGLTPPAAGELRWKGVPLDRDPAAHRARLRFVGHQDALKPVLTAAETLELWRRLHGAADDAATAALARFRLAALAGTPCRFLSAGQRRRLALARLLVSPGELWLLDEPANGLDEEAVGDLLAAIMAHRARGGRVVASTHQKLPLADARNLSLADYAPRRGRADDRWAAG